MNGENELPEGWIWTSIEQITQNFDGKRIPVKSSERKKRQGSYPYYGASGIIDTIDDFLFDGEFLLISEDGANLEMRSTAIAFIARGKFWVNNHAHIVKTKGKIPLKFPEFFFNSFDLQKYLTGSAQPKLTQSNLNKIPIPLPPLAEQRRIVAAVEALLARVNASRERLDRVPGLLKAFRQAVLAAACSGRLTEGWRGEHPNLDPIEKVLKINPIASDALPFLPQNWNWFKSNAIFSFVTSGSRGWAKYYSNTGAIFIRIGNLTHDSIFLDLKDVQKVNPPNNAEGKRTRVQKGDLLISITADIGSVGLIGDNIGEAYINQHIALCRPIAQISPKFIAYYLICNEGGKGQLTGMQKGATKIGLGLDDIKQISIPLPPLLEQQEIVRRVEALFALADSIEQRVATGKERADRLTQAILAKAFRGELVPTEAELARMEGRRYEPAGVLLERIKADRAKGKRK